MTITINEYKQNLIQETRSYIHTNCDCCKIVESYEMSFDEPGIKIFPNGNNNEIDDLLYNSIYEYEWDTRNGCFIIPCEEHECDELEDNLNQILSEYNYKIETTY